LPTGNGIFCSRTRSAVLGSATLPAGTVALVESWAASCARASGRNCGPSPRTFAHGQVRTTAKHANARQFMSSLRPDSWAKPLYHQPRRSSRMRPILIIDATEESVLQKSLLRSEFRVHAGPTVRTTSGISRMPRKKSAASEESPMCLKAKLQTGCTTSSDCDCSRSRGHSCRRASMGSRRAALRAGK